VIKHDIIKKEECKRLGIELLVVVEGIYNIDKNVALNKIKEFVYE